MAVDLRRYPIALLEHFQNLKEACRKILVSNAGIVDYIEARESLSLTFSSKTHPKFYFTIQDPALMDFNVPGIHVKVSSTPKNRTDNSVFTRQMEARDALSSIENWVKVLKEYDNFDVLYNPELGIEKKYELDFILAMPFGDNEDVTLPFEDEIQEKVIRLLGYIEVEIENQPAQDEETAGLVEEAKFIKNNIQRLSKQKALERIAKFVAKFRMKGYDFGKAVLKTAKDETIKYIIKQVLEGGKDFVAGFLP